MVEVVSQTASATQPVQEAEGLLTKFDLSSRLRISTRSVDEWMRKGRIPYLKIGGKTVRFRWHDVLQKLNGNRVN
jgi:excisionase family DNA binding protein